MGTCAPPASTVSHGLYKLGFRQASAGTDKNQTGAHSQVMCPSNIHCTPTVCRHGHGPEDPAEPETDADLRVTERKLRSGRATLLGRDRAWRSSCSRAASVSPRGPGPSPGRALGWGGEAHERGRLCKARGRARLRAGPVPVRVGPGWVGRPCPECSEPSPPRPAPGAGASWQLPGLGRMGPRTEGSLTPRPRGPLGSPGRVQLGVETKRQGQAPRPRTSTRKTVGPCFLFTHMPPCVRTRFFPGLRSTAVCVCTWGQWSRHVHVPQADVCPVTGGRVPCLHAPGV